MATAFTRRDSVEVRLWERIRVTESGCWEFMGARIPSGYGMLMWNGVMMGAHRVAHLLKVGPIPNGMFVCHSCDNPPCCNPDHLFLGTNSDNQRDCVEKGRHHEAVKTHCLKGHQYTPENTYVRANGTRSVECNRERQRLYRARRRI